MQSDDPDATAASAASDSELEAAVLDTLTDAILASAPSMPPPTLDRFVAIVDGGVCRPPWLARQLPHAGLGFSQACLRKLYVVAARYGAGGDGSRVGGGDGLRNGEGEEGQLPAAVAALRALLARCDHMVQAAVDAKTLGAGEGAAGARCGEGWQQQRGVVTEVLAPWWTLMMLSGGGEEMRGGHSCFPSGPLSLHDLEALPLHAPRLDVGMADPAASPDWTRCCACWRSWPL